MDTTSSFVAVAAEVLETLWDGLMLRKPWRKYDDTRYQTIRFAPA